jgi:hypothetical protein
MLLQEKHIYFRTRVLCAIDDTLVKKRKLWIPYQVYSRVRYFDYPWLLQESVVAQKWNYQSLPIPSIEPGVSTYIVKCSSHYAINKHTFRCVNLIQYKIENLSLKILQMEETGIFFKENVGKVSSARKVISYRPVILTSKCWTLAKEPSLPILMSISILNVFCVISGEDLKASIHVWTTLSLI